MTGVVIVVHGSRGERGSEEVPRVLGRVTEGVKSLLSPGVEVVGAALQFNSPKLEEAVAHLVDKGVNRIVIMPYFLFPGRHITEDIPHLVGELGRRYPQIQFGVANPLGLDKSFIPLVVECIVEAAPELSPDGWRSVAPAAIEQQSMDIIGKLLPPLPGLSEDELSVVKRIVHASGDPDLARLVKFEPSAVSGGIAAITGGSPIFTDVRMVAAGINERLVKAHGCSVACAMDEDGWVEPAKGEGLTRAASAMRHLGSRLDGAIIAIGNAPTALLALLELVDNRETRPALVVGMPVGFVRARESKDELMRRDIPYVTVAGTRGGSAVAAATVNALLKIAVEKSGRGKSNP